MPIWKSIYNWFYYTFKHLKVKNSSSGTLNIGTNGTITVSGSNYGTLSCTSSNTTYATCSVSGTTVTIVPKAVGSATITVKGAGGTNYNAINKTYAATVQVGYTCAEGTLTNHSTLGAVCVKAATKGSRCSSYYHTCTTGDASIDRYTYNPMVRKCEYGSCYWTCSTNSDGSCRESYVTPTEMTVAAYDTGSCGVMRSFYAESYECPSDQGIYLMSLCNTYREGSTYCNETIAKRYIKEMVEDYDSSYGYNYYSNKERWGLTPTYCSAPDGGTCTRNNSSVSGGDWHTTFTYLTCVVKYPSYGTKDNGGQPAFWMDVGYPCKTYSDYWSCPSGWTHYDGTAGASNMRCYKAATKK